MIQKDFFDSIGQSRKFCDVRVTSALPLKADIHRKAWHVTKVPHRSKWNLRRGPAGCRDFESESHGSVSSIVSSNLRMLHGMVLHGCPSFRRRSAGLAYFVA